MKSTKQLFENGESNVCFDSCSDGLEKHSIKMTDKISKFQEGRYTITDHLIHTYILDTELDEREKEEKTTEAFEFADYILNQIKNFGMYFKGKDRQKILTAHHEVYFSTLV